MNDKYGGKSVVKFVGLKSKMYSILDEGNNKKAQAKVTMLLLSFKNFMLHYLRKRFLYTQ